MVFDGKGLLYLAWAVPLVSLFFYIPKDKIHLALLAFLFKEFLAWPLGLYVVDIGLIQYPIRFFENASYTSFTFEFFLFPILCSYFNVYFPEDKSFFIKMMYYFLFCTGISLLELWILHNTNLIRYIHWNVYLTWISILISFYISRRFCLWFFKSYSKISS